MSKIKPSTASLITSRSDYPRPSAQFIFDAIIHMGAAQVISDAEAINLLEKLEAWRVSHGCKAVPELKSILMDDQA